MVIICISGLPGRSIRMQIDIFLESLNSKVKIDSRMQRCVMQRTNGACALDADQRNEQLTLLQMRAQFYQITTKRAGKLMHTTILVLCQCCKVHCGSPILTSQPNLHGKI